MATRVTLIPSPADNDTPVLVAKTRLRSDRRDRAAERDWLERAARPGVVPLVETPPPLDRDGFTIVTEHVGSRTLRTAQLDPLAAWRVVVEVAELLDGLHRDGLVHGKLTVDHVIIGARRVWLCSPDGASDDPSVDLDGLARCMKELQHQWEECGHGAPFGAEWAGLAERFADAADPSRSATRALHSLRRLDPGPSRGVGTPHTPRPFRTLASIRRGRSGIVFATIATALAIGPVLVMSDDEEAVASGPRIEVGDAIYAVGDEGDDVVLLPSPCDPTIPVVVLDRDTDTIWAFDVVTDGAAARAVAVVPGATDVRAEWTTGDPPCTVVVARGPAGASIIDVSPQP